MKKIILYLLILNSYCLISQSNQYYNYSIEKGKDPYMYYFRGEAEHIIQGPFDDQLSETQTIPFSWNYFGHIVSKYMISDNGYITFNIESTESDPYPKELNLENDFPLNSIFAFWFDIEMGSNSLWSDEVATATVGTTPERVHIIYWMRVRPKVTRVADESISFFVALHEEGGFDIGYTVMAGTLKISAVVGAVNSIGDEIINIEPSPEYPFPECAYGDADDECILVRQSTSGINDYLNSANLIIYPNPVYEKLYLNLAEGNKEIKIFNSIGMVVKNEAIKSNELNVTELQQGIYILSINTGTKTYIYKIIKGTN